jgi:hypothetical protein
MEFLKPGTKFFEETSKASEILSQDLSDQGMFSEHEYHLLSKEAQIKVD